MSEARVPVPGLDLKPSISQTCPPDEGHDTRVTFVSFHTHEYCGFKCLLHLPPCNGER